MATNSILLPGGDLIQDDGTLTQSILALSAFGQGGLIQFMAPVNYPVSITEAATAADTVSAAVKFPTSITEAATATDTVSAALSLTASITETATATDAIDAGSRFPVSITETATATDTTAGALLISANLVEAATATDDMSAVGAYVASLLEVATATDDLTTGATYAVSLAEPSDARDLLLAELFQPQFVALLAIAGNLTVTLRGIKRTRVVEDVRIFVSRANGARSSSPVATLVAQPDGPFNVVIPLTVSAGYLCTLQCVTTPAVASAQVTAP